MKFASRHALAFVLATMLVDIIGLGIILPVLPALIAQLTSDGLSQAARWGGLLFFVYALMQFLCAPVIGNLSDRFGRRPVLILSLLALGVDYVITGLAPTIFLLFVGRFLSGAAGASMSTVNAYIADISPPEKRAANFGLVGAAFGVGFVLGPAAGGIIGDHFGPRMPFFVAAGLALCNALYGYFVLAESLPPERRRAFDWKNANPLGALSMMRATPLLLGFLGVMMLMRLGHDANPTTWTYYTMLRYGWSPAQVGYSLMAFGATTAIVFGGLTRPIVARLGEKRAAFAGLACGVTGFVGFAFASQPWMLFAFMPIAALGGIASPALNALMSKSTSPSEQGALQGAIASAGSLITIVAPLVMSNLFAAFTAPGASVHFPGAAFVAAALCDMVAIALLAIVVSRARV